MVLPYAYGSIDERNFEQPDAFIPERWTTRKELAHNASVFVPFSVGTSVRLQLYSRSIVH